MSYLKQYFYTFFEEKNILNDVHSFDICGAEKSLSNAELVELIDSKLTNRYKLFIRDALIKYDIRFLNDEIGIFLKGLAKFLVYYSNFREIIDIEFPIGRLVATNGACCEVPDYELMFALHRHMVGDSGCLCSEDVESNRFALENGLRIFSAYKYKNIKLWIITEADRSYTTILLPSEY